MNRVTDRITAILRVQGPRGTTALAEQLGVSASTVQRALRRLDGHFTAGRARAARHALRRAIDGVTSPIPVVEVLPAGPRLVGTLHPVHPANFWFEAEDQSAWFDDLPWFLHDLRPAGYLGRQIPKRYPGFSPDVTLWNADETLRFLTHHGVDSVGALVIGQEANLALANQPLRPVADDYARLADQTLQLGPVGSSAGGEQPKFLTHVGSEANECAVLVKFSPADTGAAATRWADLLLAEHHALTSMAHAGHPAARTAVVQAGGRTFLEVARFDRVGTGRRGQVMLTAVDAEFVGLGQGWVAVMAALADQGRVTAADVRQTLWRATFGDWIGNTDMHLGNLSLFLLGVQLDGLTPAYDMLPMRYAPVAGEVVPRSFEPTLSVMDPALAWEAWGAARDCWDRIAGDERVSPGFRAIAGENGRTLDRLKAPLGRLPRL